MSRESCDVILDNEGPVHTSLMAPLDKWILQVGSKNEAPSQNYQFVAQTTHNITNILVS